jgi:hypothetical protein
MRSLSLGFVALTLAPLPFALLHCSSEKPAADAGADVVTPGNDAAPDGGEDAPGTCVPSQCPSGECAPDGTCAPKCMEPGSTCEGGLTCCGTACVDTAKNPKHCGACGVACGSAQFCTSKACKDTVVANVCENAKAAIILDGLPSDEAASAVLKGALSRPDGGCTPPVAVRDLLQGTGGSLETGTNRPTLGPGESYVAAGGGFGQKAVDWLNKSKYAPVYTTGDATSYSFVRTKDDGIIVKAPMSMLTANHDYFVIYTATDPKSGTLVLASYGLLAPGTAAAAYYFDAQVMPNRANFTKAYYAYEWTDSNTNAVPDAADAFVLLDSGP